jgi:hypothetical protein
MRRLGSLATAVRGAAWRGASQSTAGGDTRSNGLRHVSRAQVVARWKGKEKKDDDRASGTTAASRVVSKAMAFASNAGPASLRRAAPSGPNLVGTIGDISWDSCERLDHAFTYYAPKGWTLDEKVRENFLSVELSPPRAPEPEGASVEESNKGETGSSQQQQPSIHGLTITSYAYFRKVQHPDSEKLMDTFLRRFNQCMGNSVDVLSRSTPKPQVPVDAEGRPVPQEAPEPAASSLRIDEQHRGKLCDLIATRLGGSACEFTFTPVMAGEMPSAASRSEAGIGRARALCRSFFHSNRLHHYVVVMAVPEEEFEASWDLVTHAVLGVRELKTGTSA